MSKVLITGGAGFIGHHLARKLSKLGFEITILDNGQSSDLTSLNFSHTIIDKNLSDLTFTEMCEALVNVEILYHLAAEKYNSSLMTPRRVIETNITATDILFRAAVKVGVKRIVFTSSLYAYGHLGPGKMTEDDLPKPNTHYGISKLTGELLLKTATKDSSTEWNIARLMFIYGPEQFADGGYKSVIVKNFERMREGKNPIVNGSGLQELDYVYIDDCVSALVTLGINKKNNELVNVASSKGTSIIDLIRLMKKVSGVNHEVEFCPQDWTEGTVRIGSNSRIKQLFDWNPEIDIEEGLLKTWNSIRSER